MPDERRTPTLSRDQRAKRAALVISERLAGEPSHVIACRHGLSRGHVRDLAARAGHPFARGHLTSDDRAAIVARRRDGEAPASLAAEFGCSERWVRAIVSNARATEVR